MQDGASSEATAERLRHALELFDDALDMLRLSIRRRHPDISELERRVDIWLTESGGGRSSVTLPSVLAPSHVRT